MNIKNYERFEIKNNDGYYSEDDIDILSIKKLLKFGLLKCAIKYQV